MGYIISVDGIVVDLAKVQAINDWTQLHSVVDVRSFLWIVGYYHKFVEGFSKIALPLTSLTKKDALFIWMSQYEEAFQEFKGIFSSDPTLTISLGQED